MDNVFSSPTIVNCTFSGNSAQSGGGMFNSGCCGSDGPTVIGSTFSENVAGLGGGMYNGGSVPTVSECTFTGNLGGGMFNQTFGATTTVTGCVFSGNQAEPNMGGGIHNF
jgi:hypothetical protein